MKRSASVLAEAASGSGSGGYSGRVKRETSPHNHRYSSSSNNFNRQQQRNHNGNQNQNHSNPFSSRNTNQHSRDRDRDRDRDRENYNHSQSHSQSLSSHSQRNQTATAASSSTTQHANVQATSSSTPRQTIKDSPTPLPQPAPTPTPTDLAQQQQQYYAQNAAYFAGYYPGMWGAPIMFSQAPAPWPYAGPSFAPQQFDLSKPPPPLPTEADKKLQRPPLPPGNPPADLQNASQRTWGRGMFRGERGMKRNATVPIGMLNTQASGEYNGMENSLNAYVGYSQEMYEDKNGTQVNRKNKRKPMSTRYTRGREWDRDDALKALALEQEFNKQSKTPMLILRFPDPELNKWKVKQYSPMIESVHFQQPSTPRYCFVQLKQDTDIDAVCKELNEIPFGSGKVTAERKHQPSDETTSVSPEEIDPYTLYIGNLPTQISVKVVKQHFPGAQRIDIGYAQRMKYTRYAFIRYNNIEDSMEAYRNTFNKLIDSRSLIVRFRRQKGNMGLPGETKVAVRKDVQTPQELSPTIAAEIVSEEPTEIENEIIPASIAEEAIEDDDDFWNPNRKDDEEMDSKAKVLEEAREFMERTGPVENNSEFDKAEVKTEPKVPYTEPDIGLLGTQIKDEPLDDDELLAQAQCYDDDDFFDEDDPDAEPEEEDDMARAQYSPTANSHFSHYLRPRVENWEDFRRNELSKKDDKPPKEILAQLAQAKEKNASNAKSSDKTQKKDNLDDLFNRVNGNDDDDFDDDLF